MKRKFTNVFLLVAISVAALTSFVSCKDYQDDLQIEMDIQDKALDQALQALKTDLQNKIDLLDAAQKNCSTKCSTEQANLWAKFADYYTKSETYNQTEINQMLQDLKDMMGNVASGQTLVQMIDSAKAAAQGALEAANAAQEAANAAQDAADAAQGLAERDSVRLDAVDKALMNLSDSLRHAYETADLAWAQAQKNQDSIAILDKAVKDLRTYADETFATKARVDIVGDSAIKAYDKAVANEIKITNLETIVEKVRDSLSILDAKDQAMNARIDSVIEATNGWKDSIAVLREETKEIRELAKTYLDSALNVSKEIQDSLDNYIRANDARVQAALDSIGTVASAVEALEGRVKFLEDSLPGIDSRLDALEDSIAEIMPRLKAVEEKIEELEGRVEKLENRLNSLITNIIVQQAHNPIFGSINLPWGNSNLLMAFYGNATNLGVEFPTSDEALFFDGHATVTDEDLSVFTGDKFTAGANAPLCLDKEGNAGYIYVTVNPTDVDFTNTQFSLVTSQEKEIVKLGKLQKTNDELVFGWTRAGQPANGNGLYKASVTIKDNYAQAAPRVNLNVDDVKDAIKEVSNSAKSKKISEVASSLVNAAVAVSPLATTNFPAYAVKAAWTPEGGQPTAVYSKYEVGAIAVKPLSYAFAKDVVVKDVPGVGLLENAANRIVKAIKNQIPNDLFTLLGTTADEMKFDLTRIKDVELKELDDAVVSNFKVVVDIDETKHIDIDPIYYTMPDITIPAADLNQTVTFDGKTAELVFTQPITYHATSATKVFDGYHDVVVIQYSKTIDLRNDIKVIYNNVTTSLDNVNGMMAYLRGYLGRVNDLINSIEGLSVTIDSKIDALGGKLVDYIEKVNKMLVPYMQPNDWVQPILLGSANGFVRFTTTTRENPQLLNSTELTLIPTTRTVELLSPAFKKWIAVTDVINGTNSAKGNNGACVAARTKANSASQINEVIDGDVRVVKLSLEKNYTYEIVYQALDYTGRVAAKRYYVRVK